jgi:GT2 family glycosyltransferase
MVRASAFVAAGGYAEDVIAAEDDELALRLRAQGGVIARIDAPASVHDAAMYRFEQWWTRARRCGHAYAQVRWLHRDAAAPAFVRELRRTWLLGAVVPGGVALLAVPTLGLSWLVLALYPLNALRIAIATRRRGVHWRDAAAWAASCAVSPLPQAIGALQFHLDRVRARRPRLIEYKRPSHGPRGRQP